MTSGWLYGLDDPLDETFGADKAIHALGAAVLWAVAAAHFGTGVAWSLAIGASLGVELLETWRYQRWAARGFPVPWPPMTDKVSLKDLAADLVGMLGMALLLGGHP